MIVTEEEAKTKRCQETFAANPALVSLHIYEPYCCCGSACMAWRWHQPAREEQWQKGLPHPDERKEYFLAGYEVDPNDEGFMRRKIAEAVPATGYCGKAGKP